MKDQTEIKHEKLGTKILRFDLIGIIIALLVLCTVISSLSNVFFTPNNLLNILLSGSTVGIIASSMTAVILSAGLDLSVGTNVALMGVFIATLLGHGIAWPLAILMTLGMGVVTGLLNGFFITDFGINALITTLATQQIFRGLAFVIGNGGAIYIRNMEFNRVIGVSGIGSIPTPVIIFLFVIFVFFILLSKTHFGRNVYMMGGNREAARLSGINTRQYSYIIYMMSGFTAALAGIVLAARMTSGQPNAGTGYELDAITAVILGGAALTGGVGTVGGTLLGVIFMATFRNAFVLMNVNTFYQFIASGLLLLSAVTFDIIRTRRLNKIV